ncbi:MULTISPECIES: hypothetical protein [unclassified Leclercia]|uniref:Uncharacterized protein n=1 Tax=Leclercia barmai TaxID=2785629 RepID=A0ABS7S0N1_9ENTR|nr:MULTISPECIES: hypothetical protein [unclassified Leclercia]MBZ0059600.1 hypothetical protein [Leclercia sp. EMC7]MCM5697267.1 hypothetical protein [Leclercia sp. LTM01]MCM5702137.1 hypothetical protein [Leclercia sp. LTM14]
MKAFIIASVAALLALSAQANVHRSATALYEQIANRCMYIAATRTPADTPEADLTHAAMLCVNGAEHAINNSELIEAYQRNTLAEDVEQATDQPAANRAQLFLDAYDAGQVIGRGYIEPNGDDDEIYDEKGHY